MHEAQQIAALCALVLDKIQGGVWHMTNLDRFRGILRSGAILPEPEIDNSERWSTSQGSEWYPYVRTLGGVSLFDFREFNPEQYSVKYPISSWREFVPYRSAWNDAVWIEIDVPKLGATFISGAELLARWKAEKVGNRIMPEIEAAHLGPLPRTAFKNVFLVRRGTQALEELGF